jgi:Coenzyme PQQ synthesis protein D (PqqD)
MEAAMQEKRLAKNPSVVCTEMDGGAVLLDLDTTCYYSLNQTGLEIWSLLDQCPTVEAIARRLAAEYEIDFARATASTERIVSELARENLVHGDAG